jgi:hypothetical protein
MAELTPSALCIKELNGLVLMPGGKLPWSKLPATVTYISQVYKSRVAAGLPVSTPDIREDSRFGPLLREKLPQEKLRTKLTELRKKWDADIKLGTRQPFLSLALALNSSRTYSPQSIQLTKATIPKKKTASESENESKCP